MNSYLGQIETLLKRPNSALIHTISPIMVFYFILFFLLIPSVTSVGRKSASAYDNPAVAGADHNTILLTS